MKHRFSVSILASLAVVFVSQQVLAQPASPSNASVQELEQRCDQARQAKLAPERQQLIQQCIKDGGIPDYCERYWRDYGDGGATLYGNRRRGKYFDLPVCKQAEQARIARDQKTRGSTTGTSDRSSSTGASDRSSTDGVNRSR
jgi:hypothetical protein